MKMTEQAKVFIQEIMEANHVSTLRFFGVEGCCGVNISVALQEAEENDVVEQVSGLNIAMQADMKDQLTNVTIDVEEANGEMGIILNGYNNNSCC